jgi:hypothetical protein
VSRKQLATLHAHGAIERVHYDTYVLTGGPRTHEQSLQAALLWAGDAAVGDGRSAGAIYRLEGVRPVVPEITVPSGRRRSTGGVIIRYGDDRRALMIRRVRGVPVAGVEPAIVRLAHLLDAVAFEVKTRRLLVSHGLTGFEREFPLEWNGRTYRYDFAFPHHRTILETNGRRWHDDASDYEHDHEKWSVPGRHGLRLVLATWDKVTRTPDDLVVELATTMAPRQSSSAL